MAASFDLSWSWSWSWSWSGKRKRSGRRRVKQEEKSTGMIDFEGDSIRSLRSQFFERPTELLCTYDCLRLVSTLFLVKENPFNFNFNLNLDRKVVDDADDDDHAAEAAETMMQIKFHNDAEKANWMLHGHPKKTRSSTTRKTIGLKRKSVIFYDGIDDVDDEDWEPWMTQQRRCQKKPRPAAPKTKTTKTKVYIKGTSRTRLYPPCDLAGECKKIWTLEEFK